MNFAYVLIALSAIPLGITIFNALTMRVVRPNSDAHIKQKIAVLVPMRNEERNVDSLVASLQASQNYSALSITVLDDNSTDSTNGLLNKYESIDVLQGRTPPEGWLGKNFACHQLSQSNNARDSDYLVFVDADVRLAPLAVSSAIAKMESIGWDFISPYPKQIATSFIEKLVQPLLQWSFMSSLPLRIAERLSFESMVVANGQFFVVKRSAYQASGGHESIKTQVLDDLELAKSLTRSGYRGGVADASQIARCHMYTNKAELFEGYRKSLWKAFGNPLAGALVSLFLCATGVLPLLLGLFISPLYFVAYLLTLASRYLSALRTKSGQATVALHCFSIAIFIYLLTTSWRGRASGQLTWRGRKI